MSANDQNIYCCRKKMSLSKNVHVEQIQHTKSGTTRNALKGICSVCGAKQSKFISSKQGGSILNNILNSGKLPELHIPGHNYTGPGTKLKERLLRGDEPVKQLDKAAQFHDMAYAIFKDTKDRHIFDNKLQDEAFEIAKSSNNTLLDRAEGALVGSVMFAKHKLGLGVKQRKNK